MFSIQKRTQRSMSVGLCVFFVALGSFGMAKAQLADQSLAGSANSSLVRTIGAICGAGLPADVQGELDGALSRILERLDANGETSIALGQIADLLEAFEPSGRAASHSVFMNCVAEVIGAVSGVASAGGSQTRDLEIQSVILPAPLSTILASTQQFSLSVGDTRRLKDPFFIITITRTTSGEVYIDYADLVEGSSSSTKARINQVRQLNNCDIAPYSIEDETISFLMNCK